MSKWKKQDRYAFVLVAVCAYVVSIFLAWWNVTMIGDSESPAVAMRIDGMGAGYGSNRLSELCVVIAVAILVLTGMTLRSSDSRLLLALRHLAIALMIFNALAVLELWRMMKSMFSAPSFYRGSEIAYGAPVAIGMSILVLWAVLVLEAGGVRKLLNRRREDATEPPPSS